ncbi:MAG: LuxR family transcriptional regulator [Candidatus Devosia phytovorans]|uniref:LuxR family transcriptional regulator n=1 Tax=Candidatus Devosia phytovorans TaxID=3121372 RepID=A0AAJ5VRL6_9HYPH|nr:LuxR family transcriptional regulator [Devosia sp.]WEK03506.1 MAG: LuxR family transcriptional regulator [Devosia sp.]
MNADLTTTIKAIQQQQDLRGMLGVFRAAIADYGFHSFFIAGVPTGDLDITDTVLLSGGKEEWFAEYVANGYVRHDPVARQCLHTSMPFDWDDAPYDPVTEPEMHQMIQLAATHGLVSGLCVPIHIDGALAGAVSLMGDPKGLKEQQVLELHMLSLYTYGQLRYLHSQPEPGRVISEREAEVLTWVAAGKTASDIAEITGLSPRTINQHCENAQRRLGTSNRVHTVVEALRLGMITV